MTQSTFNLSNCPHKSQACRDNMCPDCSEFFESCQLCGHKGLDVHSHYWYIGGRGNTLQVLCDDIMACQSRMVQKVKEEAVK